MPDHGLAINTNTPLGGKVVATTVSSVLLVTDRAAYIGCCHMRVPGQGGQAPSNICSHPATARSGSDCPVLLSLSLMFSLGGRAGLTTTPSMERRSKTPRDSVRSQSHVRGISRDAVSSRNALIRQRSGRRCVDSSPDSNPAAMPPAGDRRSGPDPAVDRSSWTFQQTRPEATDQRVSASPRSMFRRQLEP